MVSEASASPPVTHEFFWLSEKSLGSRDTKSRCWSTTLAMDCTCPPSITSRARSSMSRRSNLEMKFKCTDAYNLSLSRYGKETKEEEEEEEEEEESASREFRALQEVNQYKAERLSDYVQSLAMRLTFSGVGRQK